MTLKELAQFRMLRGKVNHQDQNWESLTVRELTEELVEELADVWNYSEKYHPLKRGIVRFLTQMLWWIVGGDKHTK